MKRRRKARDGLLPANRMLPFVVPTWTALGQETAGTERQGGANDDAPFCGRTARPAAWSCRFRTGPSACAWLSPRSGLAPRQARTTAATGAVGGSAGARTSAVISPDSRTPLTCLSSTASAFLSVSDGTENSTSCGAREWRRAQQPPARPGPRRRQGGTRLERHAHALGKESLHRGGGVHATPRLDVGRARRRLALRQPRHHGADRGAREAQRTGLATEPGAARKWLRAARPPEVQGTAVVTPAVTTCVARARAWDLAAPAWRHWAVSPIAAPCAKCDKGADATNKNNNNTRVLCSLAARRAAR